MIDIHIRDIDDFSERAKDADYVVIDTETSGNGDDAQIVEIGAVLVKDYLDVGQFSQLIRIRGRLSSYTTELTGIQAKDLQDQPLAKDIIPKFVESIKELKVVGHNIPFDMRVLNAENMEIGNKLVFPATVDTERISEQLFPDLASHTLQSVMTALKLDDVEQHRALSDAIQTFEVWEILTTGNFNKPSDEDRENVKKQAEENKKKRGEIYFRSLMTSNEIVKSNEQPDGDAFDVTSGDYEGAAVKLSKDASHVLGKYGYDSWLWVTVEKGKIRDGKYEGYSTYFVTLDGEEIGYLPVTQMKYHSGQIPGDSAVMIIHIPNSKTDKEKGRFGAKLQMPYRHAAINLYELKED